MKFTHQLAFLFILIAASAQQPAVLHCERKTYPEYGQTNPVTVIYITGGQSNVQYQVDTPSGKNVASTNWSYTYRMYSRDFVNPPAAAERIVSSSADPNFRASEFYRIRGILTP